jgi:hypothetical protein
MSRGLLRIPVAAFVTGVAVLAGNALGTGTAGVAPRVTLIGDSVADSLAYTPAARAILAAGIDLRLELAPCRRVGQASCSYAGVRPPTVIDLVPTLGAALGRTVVIAVGYNDFEPAYAGNIEDALAALRKAGVTQVLWLTLREVHPAYVSMNLAIHAAAARHPELTVVDWQLYSRSHPEWFQSDGLHLVADGAMGMATLVHHALDELGIPLALPTTSPLSVVATRLPVATVGRPYSARLASRGGVGQIRWRLARGTPPRGLTLRADGRIVGIPRQPGSFRLTVRATDAASAVAVATIELRVRSR